MLDTGSTELQLHVDVRNCTIKLMDNGQVLKTYPVAVGTKKTPTPVGEYRIADKAVWGGAFGTRWMKLDVPWGTYGIHGTNRPASIGQAVSHGCIRMFNRHVEELYDRVSIGTKVVVSGPIRRETLVPGSAGRLVQLVQTKLKESGMYAGPTNGKFGPDMEKAVIQWQKSQNMELSGQIRSKELDLLGIDTSG